MKILKEYSLNPKTEVTFKKKHPWIFSGQVKNKAQYSNGDFVRIVSKETAKTEGIGIFSNEGLISIRIIYFGENFRLSEVRRMVLASMNRRKALLQNTDSLRWIHGENDGFPGITIDMHGDTLVVMVYSDSLYGYARYVSRVLYYFLTKELAIGPKPKNVVFRIPARMGRGLRFNKKEIRAFRGFCPKNIIIHYRNLTYRIDPVSQKGGTFDDLRNLRNFILENRSVFAGNRILNLFSNNGLTSIVFEKAGAKEIISIDSSEKSIQIQKDNLRNFESRKHKIFKLDIFKNLMDFLEGLDLFFDTIVIDPPSLTSSSSDIIKAKKIYSRLIDISAPFLAEKGIMILSSCSNRIHKNEFERICKESLNQAGRSYKKPIKLENEIDHPIIPTFPEGDYLKVHIYFMI